MNKFLLGKVTVSNTQYKLSLTQWLDLEERALDKGKIPILKVILSDCTLAVVEFLDFFEIGLDSLSFLTPKNNPRNTSNDICVIESLFSKFESINTDKHFREIVRFNSSLKSLIILEWITFKDFVS
jgi:hypothetical protein